MTYCPLHSHVWLVTTRTDSHTIIVCLDCGLAGSIPHATAVPDRWTLPTLRRADLEPGNGTARNHAAADHAELRVWAAGERAKANGDRGRVPAVGRD